MAAAWTCKFRWRTGLSADSVEWCPVERYREILVCGTYELEDQDSTKQKRLGKIYLFAVDDATTELNPIQTIDTSGILDLKWCYHEILQYPMLAAVTSTGDVQLYRLINENGMLLLNIWKETTIGGDFLALSVDWSTNKTVSNEPLLVVSDSSGTVTLMKILGDEIEKVAVRLCHGYEAWVAAFNYWNHNIFYSGGDDCLFKCHDVRAADAVSSNKSHEAGVTSIRSHTEVEHQLLTGSYDEKVRLWDTRNLKKCINEVNAKGGVWRLKWHPLNIKVILAACMYGGFRVLTVDEEISVVAEYLSHESIAYGADWQFGKLEPSVAATCSFYDKSLHIGKIIMN